MRHCTYVTAAGLALFSTHAMAAPFSPQASSSISEPESANQNGLAGYLVDMTLSLVGFFEASKPADQEFVLSYRHVTDQCPDKAQEKQEEVIDPVQEKSRPGPEPIYFGF